MRVDYHRPGNQQRSRARRRVALALALLAGGIIGLAVGFSTPKDSARNQVEPASMEARFGLVMTVIGVQFLLSARRRVPDDSAAQRPVNLLLAGLLIVVGSMGLAARAGSRTWAELGLEMLMLTVGTIAFVSDLWQARPVAEEKKGA